MGATLGMRCDDGVAGLGFLRCRDRRLDCNRTTKNHCLGLRRQAFDGQVCWPLELGDC